MDVYDTNLEKLNENTPLAILAREIRRLDGIQRGLTRNALRVALDEGDVLTLGQAQRGSGPVEELARGDLSEARGTH